MRRLACAPLLLTATARTPARASEEQDKFEEQAVARAAQQKAERGLRADCGERGGTLRDLEAAFPGKVARSDPGAREDEGEAWFALVAGGGDEWRKADTAAAGLGPMFERWRQRLEFGPVSSIKRDEFLRFARLIVRNAARMQNEGGVVNTGAEADKVFRVLNLDTLSHRAAAGTRHPATDRGQPRLPRLGFDLLEDRSMPSNVVTLR